MDITSTEAISFNLFYLVEFLNLTLRKIEDKIADSHFKLLKNISSYLVKEKNIIDGLEKIAKYQQTNDLAIFLFDMIERANDYDPKIVYNNLPDLADDFINLYSLMVEDDDCVKTLQKIEETYRTKFADAKQENEPEESVEVAKPDREKDAKEKIRDEISFKEFYRAELLNRAGDKIGQSENNKKIIDVCGILTNFTKIGEDYSPAIKNIYSSIKSILPDEDKPGSALYENIDSNAAKLASLVGDFQKNEKDEFNAILNSGEVPTVIIENQEKEEKIVEETELAGKSGIDTLLVLYFKSEVEDNYKDLKSHLEKGLSELNKKQGIQLLVKKFKSLKEVSMIHGYSGLEYIAQLLSAQFTDLGGSENGLSEDSVKILVDIYSDLLQVENYADKSHSQKNVDAVKEKINALANSFIPIEEETEPKPVSPKEAADEEITEPRIGINDRKDFETIIQSFFNTISTRVFACHKNLDSDESKSALSQTLDLVLKNCDFFHEQLAPKIIAPMASFYESILQDKEPLPAETIDVLESVWKILSETAMDAVDFDSVNKTIEGLKQPKPEPVLGINDQRTQDAFIESARKEWAGLKAEIKNTLTDGNDSENVNNFLDGLENNLELLGYSNYLPFIDFVKEKIKGSIETPLNDEIASEIENAFKLFFDRMQHHGKKGNCSDILSVLHDITETEKALTETGKIDDEPENLEGEGSSPNEEVLTDPEPELETVKDDSPEKDTVDGEFASDLALFREEAKGHIKAIHENLEAFSKGKERKNLVEIENACHSVRSSAHYLNLKDVSKLAATIEDAAELFGKSEFPIPGDLGPSLLTGVETLETLISDPSAEFSETMEMLEALLDNVVIEDVGAKDEDQFGFDKIEIEKQAQKKNAEEKPLFAEGAEKDEELLELFREESTTFLSNISESNKILSDSPNDDEAVKTISYASHSLKSASKMLGFLEISQITDSLEKIMDSILNRDVTYSPELNKKISGAIEILEKLSDGETLATEKISGIIYDLELDNWVTPDSEDDDELPENMVAIFVEEAREHIAGLNDDYLELEKMPESEMILSNILRRMHTLKGSAYISKFNLIGDLAHKLEDYFDLYKQKDSSVKNDMIDTAFVSLDLTSDMVNSIAENGNDKIDQFTTRLAEIDNKIFTFQNYGETSVLDSGDSKMLSVPAAKLPQKKKSEEDKVIKISTEYMDKLLDMASELMINQTQLGAHFHFLKDILNNIESEKKQIRGAENILEDAIEFGVLSGQESVGENSANKEQMRKMSDNIKDVVRAVNVIHGDLHKLSEGFEQNIGRLSRISKLLHSDMLKTRMVPVDNLFNRYPRAVRDMAQKQKKKVNLIIEDNNTEMDRAMVEGLAEPILHIIRNAIDHGLETPEERMKNEKLESGTLLLKARQEKNQIIIDITDDGRGIDIEGVRLKIIEKKLAEKAQVKKMSEAEILDYIFMPGFSTRDEATDVSGRGIGLYSVSTQIQKLKGNIRIKTETDMGTSFSLRVPLTLVISQALMVKVDNQPVAVPVIAVQEAIQFNMQDIISDEDKKYIRVRGRLLPYIFLGDVLKFGPDNPERVKKEQQTAVIIYDAGVSIALGIDELVGRQEVVIKTLGSHLQNVDYISGGTILANGDVALILDFALVIRTIEMHFFGKVSERPVSKKLSQKKETKVSKKDPKPQEKKPLNKTEKKKELKKEGNDTPATTQKKRTIINRKPKIIIVDDSNSVRNFVGSILERNGYFTIKSNNGADALEKMKIEKVDLMITDLEMPKMHGFDLISNIREQKKYDNLPIIILTGRAGMKHRQTGEDLGANAFIVKPFKEKDLLQSLSEFIQTGEQ